MAKGETPLWAIQAGLDTAVTHHPSYRDLPEAVRRQLPRFLTAKPADLNAAYGLTPAQVQVLSALKELALDRQAAE